MASGTKERVDEPSLAFIVTAARSGSTLLRFLIDDHPEVGCPAEAGIGSLLAQTESSWGVAFGSYGSNGSGANLDGEIRAPAARLISAYCELHGSKIYCDKTPDSVFHLNLVNRHFPSSRYLLLFRHVMDVVASGLEAFPWGFDAGYLRSVQNSPDNFVAGLVSYWCTHVGAALEWEEKCPGRCHHMRYEDLVSDPAGVMSAVFQFLEVDPDAAVTDTAGFRYPLDAPTVGDFKIPYAQRVHSESIGRGKRVPVQLIAEPLMAETNRYLERLGYQPLSADWNSIAWQDPRPPAVAEDGWVGRLSTLVRSLEGEETTDLAANSPACQIVADDRPGLEWPIGRSGEPRPDAPAVAPLRVVGTAEDLAKALAGEEDLGLLAHAGRVRCFDAAGDAVNCFPVFTTLREMRHPVQVASPAR